jgi:prolyl oligopeptidase
MKSATNWEALSVAGYQAMQQADYQAAFALFEKALPKARRYGPSDERLAYTIRSLGICRVMCGSHSEGAKLLNCALEMYTGIVGAVHQEVGRALSWLAYCLSLLNDYEEAERVYRRALAVYLAIEKDNPVKSLEMARSVGDCLLRLGKHRELVLIYKQAFGLLKRVEESESVTYLACGLVAAQSLMPAAMKVKTGRLLDQVLRLGQRRFKRLNPPSARKIAHTDVYNGVSVTDEFRWLESTAERETIDWVSAQERYSNAFLSCSLWRERFADSLRVHCRSQLKFSVPYKAGELCFFSHRPEHLDQPVIYCSKVLGQFPRTVLDPNQFVDAGNVWVSDSCVSPDGRLLAYALTDSGSDWMEWRVRQVDNGRDLKDVVKWTKYHQIAWNADGKGFFYVRFRKPSAAGRLSERTVAEGIYYHRLKTSQRQDKLIFRGDRDERLLFSCEVSRDGRYLVIYMKHPDEIYSRVLCKPLTGRARKALEIFGKGDASYQFVGNVGNRLLFRTNKNADKGRVVAVDLPAAMPKKLSVKGLIAEDTDILTSAILTGDRLIVHYLSDAESRLCEFDLNGKLVRPIKLPARGSVVKLDAGLSKQEVLFEFSSFVRPETIYRYSCETGKVSSVFEPDLSFCPRKYLTEKVFFRSKDGTKIPMFISRRKDLTRDGTNPTCLYGYGGWAISRTPQFSNAVLAWMEMGGVYAEPCIRGGGEYGDRWHRAAAKVNKQKSIDDFIAAAEYLIAKRYTSARKLAIKGESNGGMLVGAAITQRPELFGAAVVTNGTLDMLRFNKFTVGWSWQSEFGSPDISREFKALYAYSPLHRVKAGTVYPATLISTADHDDRVVPCHSYKFAAALQSAQAGDAPILLRINHGAGHGGSVKRSYWQTDELSFLATVLAMKVPKLV